ncbi:MAG TPA: hypothetical protein VEO74_02270 [Thermoanaerobaculia bacterium]|nr:hypothetical protein [Thermoanaerobaculia bacterium]
MNRTTFIVDGFNLYHPVEDAARQLGLGSRGKKWLDLEKRMGDAGTSGRQEKREHIEHGPDGFGRELTNELCIA